MKHTLAASAAIAALVIGGIAAAAPATAAPPPGPGHPGHPGHSGGRDARELLRYATDTWTSMAAMAHPDTGLVDDNIEGDLDAASASGYTSPTNIGGYLWSTVTARDLGIITPDDARQRLTTTITTLEHMERNPGSGMFYNWYAPATGAKLTIFPTSGDTIHPFLSTVDNGWLATALRSRPCTIVPTRCTGRWTSPRSSIRPVPRGFPPARTGAGSGRRLPATDAR